MRISRTSKTGEPVPSTGEPVPYPASFSIAPITPSGAFLAPLDVVAALLLAHSAAAIVRLSGASPRPSARELRFVHGFATACSCFRPTCVGGCFSISRRRGGARIDGIASRLAAYPEAASARSPRWPLDIEERAKLGPRLRVERAPQLADLPFLSACPQRAILAALSLA